MKKLILVFCFLATIVFAQAVNTRGGFVKSPVTYLEVGGLDAGTILLPDPGVIRGGGQILSLGSSVGPFIQSSSGQNILVDSTGCKCTSLKMPVVHGTGTAKQAIQTGGAAATAGALAVTFTTAFSAAPNCVCTVESAGGILPCNISVAASTSGVTFLSTGAATAVIRYICIGNF